MSFYHSFPSMFVKRESKPYQLSVTQAGESIALGRMSKQLVIKNIGTNVVYIAFDKAATVADGYKLEVSGTTFLDVLDIDFQTENIYAICDTGETANLNVLAIY